MRLHLDRSAFSVLIDTISERTNIRRDIIEKDYYVCMVLKELASKQEAGLKSYLKGGTALYKILGNLNRFSEDIDLTVDVTGLTNTQKSKMLKKSTKEFCCLEYIEDSLRNANSLTSVYQYKPLTEIGIDPLQRFGKVKVESTSFTISEPVETHMIYPLLFQKASSNERNILESIFETKGIRIATITLERIFIDKLFAAESSFLKRKFYDVSKHLYDIYQLFQLDRIRQFCMNKSFVESILKIQRSEELNRYGGIDATQRFLDFKILREENVNNVVTPSFERMQDVYIFQLKDRISMKEINECQREILKMMASYETHVDW